MEFKNKTRLNGILKFYYKRNKQYYKSDIEIMNSKSNPGFNPESSFNFNSSNYWIGTNVGANANYIGFCLTNGFAVLTGYELKAPKISGNLPKIWSLSGSIDKTNYFDEEKTTHSMGLDDIYYVQWKHGPYKCFKLNIIDSNVGNIVFDLEQIEVYGILYDPRYLNIRCTCALAKNHISSFQFFILALLSQS